jgi:hypothetical protein
LSVLFVVSFLEASQPQGNNGEDSQPQGNTGIFLGMSRTSLRGANNGRGLLMPSGGFEDHFFSGEHIPSMYLNGRSRAEKAILRYVRQHNDKAGLTEECQGTFLHILMAAWNPGYFNAEPKTKPETKFKVNTGVKIKKSGK